MTLSKDIKIYYKENMIHTNKILLFPGSINGKLKKNRNEHQQEQLQ